MKSDRDFRLGLIGQGISYSLSPRIHTWALAAAGLRGNYLVHDVNADHARTLIQSDEWDGLNVTIPFKTQAIEFCDSLTETARLARSVNTLFRRDGNIVGNSTDGIGFLFALRQFPETRIAFDRVLVIGSGGAARSILLALRESNIASEVSVAVREPARAEKNLAYLQSGDFQIEVNSVSEAARELRRFDLIVQATPMGDASHPGLPLSPPLHFKQSACVVDLIYAPRRTEFLRIADEQGACVQNGIAMLIGQAAASFEMWTGAVFPRELAWSELMPELEQS